MLFPIPTKRSLLIRYEQIMFAQSQQSAACNATHLTEARLCKWLLRMQDLADGDDLAVTHEFLAQMIGVRRTSVSIVAGALQKAGLCPLNSLRAENPGVFVGVLSGGLEGFAENRLIPGMSDVTGFHILINSTPPSSQGFAIAHDHAAEVQEQGGSSLSNAPTGSVMTVLPIGPRPNIQLCCEVL